MSVVLRTCIESRRAVKTKKTALQNSSILSRTRSQAQASQTVLSKAKNFAGHCRVVGIGIG